MNWQRIALLGVLGGTLVALIARAATPATPPAPMVPTLLPPAPPVATAAMFAEVERLRSRLRAPIQPAAPTRNLFAFRSRSLAPPSRRAAPPAAEPVAVALTPTAPVRRSPAYALIGLAEDAGPDGPVRTAILSSGAGLTFARLGDQVGEYRVTAIAADALQLTAADDPTPFVITLK